jgi:hypothetical protein
MPGIMALRKKAKVYNIQISSSKSCAGITNGRVRLSTVDLLIKVACFVKKVRNVFNIKMSSYKLVSARKLTAPTFPFQ